MISLAKVSKCATKVGKTIQIIHIECLSLVVQYLKKKMCYLILINHHPNIDKIYLYAIDPYQPKYQVLINKRQQIGQIIL